MALVACAALPFAAGGTGASQPQPTKPATGPIFENFNLSTLDTDGWALVTIFEPDGTERADWPRVGMDSGPSVRLSTRNAGLLGIRVCNWSTFRYRLVGEGGLRAEQILQTMAACDEPVMRLEVWVNQQLSKVRRFRLVTSSGDLRLMLFFADGSRWELAGHPMTP